MNRAGERRGTGWRRGAKIEIKDKRSRTRFLSVNILAFTVHLYITCLSLVYVCNEAFIWRYAEWQCSKVSQWQWYLLLTIHHLLQVLIVCFYKCFSQLNKCQFSMWIIYKDWLKCTEVKFCSRTFKKVKYASVKNHLSSSSGVTKNSIRGPARTLLFHVLWCIVIQLSKLYTLPFHMLGWKQKKTFIEILTLLSVFFFVIF